MLATAFLEFTIGNILSVVILGALGAAGFYRLRGIKNEALEGAVDFWRDEAGRLTETLDEARTRNAELEKGRDDQRAAKHEAMNALAAERMKTDLTIVIKQLADSHAEVVRRVSDVESTISGQLAQMTETQETMVETMQGMLGAISTLSKRAI